MQLYYDNNPVLSRLLRLNYKSYKLRGLEVAYHGFHKLENLIKDKQSPGCVEKYRLQILG